MPFMPGNQQLSQDDVDYPDGLWDLLGLGCVPPPGSDWEDALAANAPDILVKIDNLVGVGLACIGGVCASQPELHVKYRNLDQHAPSICRLCLGEVYDIGWVQASVSAGYLVDPPDTFESLISELMPEFWAIVSLSLAAGVTPSSIGVEFEDDPVEEPGLFWKAGYFAKALRWSAVITHAFASYAVDAYPEGAPNPCGIEYDEFRDRVANTTLVVPDGHAGRCNSITVKIDLLQGGEFGVVLQVDRQAAHAAGGWTNEVQPINSNVINVCPASMERGARADYLLWWASRCLAWARECGSRWHAFAAIVSARMAVRSLVEIAGLITHEVAHQLTGTEGHCWDPASLQPRDCCTHKTFFMLKHRIVAGYGLPVLATDAYPISYKEDVKTGCGLDEFGGVDFGEIPGLPGQGITGRAKHTDVLELGHCVQVNFTFVVGACQAVGSVNAFAFAAPGTRCLILDGEVAPETDDDDVPGGGGGGLSDSPTPRPPVGTPEDLGWEDEWFGAFADDPIWEVA